MNLFWCEVSVWNKLEVELIFPLCCTGCNVYMEKRERERGKICVLKRGGKGERDRVRERQKRERGGRY